MHISIYGHGRDQATARVLRLDVQLTVIRTRGLARDSYSYLTTAGERA